MDIVPNVLRGLQVKVFIYCLQAQWAVHLSGDQPLPDAGQAVDMVTGQTQRVLRVPYTHRARLQTKPGHIADRL